MSSPMLTGSASEARPLRRGIIRLEWARAVAFPRRTSRSRAIVQDPLPAPRQSTRRRGPRGTVHRSEDSPLWERWTVRAEMTLSGLPFLLRDRTEKGDLFERLYLQESSSPRACI